MLGFNLWSFHYKIKSLLFLVIELLGILGILTNILILPCNENEICFESICKVLNFPFQIFLNSVNAFGKFCFYSIFFIFHKRIAIK